MSSSRSRGGGGGGGGGGGIGGIGGGGGGWSGSGGGGGGASGLLLQRLAFQSAAVLRIHAFTECTLASEQRPIGTHVDGGVHLQRQLHVPAWGCVEQEALGELLGKH